MFTSTARQVEVDGAVGGLEEDALHVRNAEERAFTHEVADSLDECGGADGDISSTNITSNLMCKSTFFCVPHVQSILLKATNSINTTNLNRGRKQPTARADDAVSC